MHHPKAKRNIAILIVLLVALGAGIYLLSASGLDRALVEKQLQTIAQNVTARAKAEGQNVRFRYDNVEITGDFFSRHIVLANPRLEFSKSDEPNTPVDFALGTSQCLIYPKSVDLRSYRLELPAPLQIKADGKTSVAELAFNGTTAFLIENRSEAGQETMNYKVELPDTATFKVTVPAVTAAEGGEPSSATKTEIYTLSYDKNPKFSGVTDANGNALQSNVEFAHVKMVDGAGKQIFAASRMASTLDNKPAEAGKRDVASLLAFDEVSMPEGANLYGPVSFVMDIGYIGQMPQDMREFDVGMMKGGRLKVRSFGFNTKDFKIHSVGDLTFEENKTAASANSALPMPVAAPFAAVGSLNVKVEHFDFLLGELEKHSLLDANGLASLDKVLQKLTGKPAKENKDLALDFKGNADGKWMINDTSFAELVAGIAGPASAGVSASGMTPIPALAAPVPAVSPGVIAPAAGAPDKN